MEEQSTIARRVVKVQFDFSRKGDRMLAKAYERLLASLGSSEPSHHSVQDRQSYRLQQQEVRR